MKHIIFLLPVAAFICATANAQMNVGSNQAPDSSAMLQVSGNAKGFLPPRMARDTMLLIRKPAKGLIVFNTTDSLLYMRRDSGWTALTAGADPGWLKSGNAGTNAANFLGTTDSKSFRLRTANTQRMLLDSLGNVAIGSSPVYAASAEKLLVDAGTTSSFNVISGKGDINNYLQLNIQNRNAGTTASSDMVATADNGDETNNYVDLGINSSGNTANYFGGANDAYLYNLGQNLLIGTGTANKSLVFMTGGTAQSTNERMRINGSGFVGIGTNNPLTALHVSAASDPLTLNGVQTGTSVDSILTISGSVIKKIANSFLTVSSSNAWSLVGNNNTLSNNYFLGTTNTDPLIIKVNNQPTGRLDAVNTYLGYQSGYNNSTNANQNTGIGYHALYANSTGTYNTAIGYGALQNIATGTNNIGVGNNASVINNSTNSIAMGTNAVVNNSYSIAVGTSAQTNNTNAISIGNNSYTNGNYGIAIGNGVVNSTPKTQANADFSTAMGYSANAGSTNSISIGSSTYSGAANAIAIGNMAAATGANSVAIGYNAIAVQDNTIVLGDKSNSNVSVAIGPESFTANAREKLLVDAGTSNSFNVISAKGSLNNYLQMNVQNRFGGTNASSDLVATADNGDENSNYVDLGINSSANTSNTWGGVNDAYLYAQTNNLLIGTAGTAKSLSFLTGGGAQSTNERMRIDGNGKVGIGITAPTATLQLKAGTMSPNTAPLKLTSGANLSTPEAGAVEFDGTNYFVTSGSSRYTLAKTLTNTGFLIFGSTATGTSITTQTISVPGAVDGDVVSLGIPASASSNAGAGVFSAYVSSANTVTVKFTFIGANTPSASTPFSGNFRVSVLKY